MQADPISEGESAVNPYEADDAVHNWLKAYEIEKEREFISRIDRFIPSTRVKLLDIGCGTGLHTFLWSERNKDVTASDFSTKFRDYIERKYHFPFIWTDVLKCTIEERYDVCFCMAIATILLDEKRRFQTFETLARLVRAGGFLVLVTASNQWMFGGGARSARKELHAFDARDAKKLRDVGFRVKRVFYWSSSPRALWRRPGLKWVGKLIEDLASPLGVGARKVVVCERRMA